MSFSRGIPSVGTLNCCTWTRDAEVSSSRRRMKNLRPIREEGLSIVRLDIALLDVVSENKIRNRISVTSTVWIP